MKLDVRYILALKICLQKYVGLHERNVKLYRDRIHFILLSIEV